MSTPPENPGQEPDGEPTEHHDVFHDEPTRQHPVVPRHPTPPSRPRQPVPPQPGAVPPVGAVPPGVVPPSTVAPNTVPTGAVAPNTVPTNAAVPPTYAVAPDTHVEPYGQPEEHKPDWVMIVVGVLIGLLLGAAIVYFLTKDNNNSDNNARVTEVQQQLERSQNANNKLRDQVKDLKSDLSSTKEDLADAKKNVDQQQEQTTEAEAQANEDVGNLREALTLVQSGDYNEAADKVTGNTDSRQAVRKAIADNLAAKALESIANDDLDQANESIDQGRDYPTTDLAKAARDAYAAASSQTETPTDPSTGQPVTPTP